MSKANTYVFGPLTRSLTRNNKVLGSYVMIQSTFVWLYSSLSIYPTPWNSQSCNFLCCFRPYSVWVCESNPTVESILSQVTPVHILMQNICKIYCIILPSAVLFLLWSPPFYVQLWSLFSILVRGDVVLCFCFSDDFLQMIVDYLWDNRWIWKIGFGSIGFTVLSIYIIISKLKAKPVTKKSKKTT